MSSVVFILGAGASRQAGAPLMADFLEVAARLLRSGLVEDKRASFEMVFRAIGALQAVHSKSQLDLSNIESIFTALELGRIIQKVPGLTHAQIPEAIAALKDLIVKTIEVTMKFPTVHGKIHAPTPYTLFATLIKHLITDAFPNQSVSIITFNYDIGIDTALYELNLGVDYIIEESPDRFQRIPLLKLHGSLNWALDIAEQKIRPLHLREFFSAIGTIDPFNLAPSKTVVPIGSQLVDFFKRKKSIAVRPEPVIIPPSWNKADYHEAVSDVWAAAAKHLGEAEQIFIVGYSLPETDSFFRHLFALGSVGSAPLQRIMIFNPDDSGLVDQRFKALLGPGAIAQYSYRALPFSKAITAIHSLFPKRDQ